MILLFYLLGAKILGNFGPKLQKLQIAKNKLFELIAKNWFLGFWYRALIAVTKYLLYDFVILYLLGAKILANFGPQWPKMAWNELFVLIAKN